MENDFPPEYDKFTMRLVDDHRRFDTNPADAFSEILQEIASDTYERVCFDIGTKETEVLIDTLRKRGFLSKNFPNAAEFLKLFAPGGKTWECSPRDPWDNLCRKFRNYVPESEFSRVRVERIHPLLLKFLSKLYIDEELRSQDYVSFRCDFPDVQLTFFPATEISPLEVQIHFRHTSEGFESWRMRSIAAALGLVAYYGDEELVEGNPWERRDDLKWSTMRENNDDPLDCFLGLGNDSEEKMDDQPHPVSVRDEELFQRINQALAHLIDSEEDELSRREAYDHRINQEKVQAIINFPTLVEFVEGMQAFGILLENER